MICSKENSPLMEKQMRHRYNRFFVETGKELVWVFVNTSLNIALTPHIEHFRVKIKACYALCPHFLDLIFFRFVPVFIILLQLYRKSLRKVKGTHHAQISFQNKKLRSS